MYLYISLLNNWFNRLQSQRFNCNQGINIENKLTGSQNPVGQFVHDIISNQDGAVNRGHKQTDLIIMDFAKGL